MKKKKITNRLYFILFALAPFLLNAQGWQKLFDSSSHGQKVIQAQDGNLVFLGDTGSPNSYPQLYKTDLEGNEIWAKSYLLFDQPSGEGLLELPNGELLIIGNRESTVAVDKDIFLLRTDPQGNQISVDDFGGTGFESGTEVIRDASGNLFLIGSTSSFGAGEIDLFVLKLDAAGAVLWQSTFGFSGNEYVSGGELLPDGGLMLLGGSDDPVTGDDQIYLLRMDADGNEMWSQLIGETDYDERNGQICPTADGNFFITMPTEGDFGQADILVKKIAPDGNEIWSQTYPFPDAQDPNSIEPTDDGGFIVGGRTDATGAKVFLLKADADGNLEWTKKIRVGQLDIAEDVIQLDDGGYAFCGRGNINFTRMFIGRTDSQGSVFSNTITGRIVLDSDDDCSLDTVPDGQAWKVTLTGSTQDFSGFANANGEFEILADTGGYQVVISPIGTNPSTVEICQPVADLNLVNFYQTSPLGDLIFHHIQAPTETITGFVFYDTNGNCTFDPDEMPVECATVPFAPEGQFDIAFSGETDENGFYEVEVPIDDWYFPGGAFWSNNFWNCSLGTCNIDGGYVTMGQTFSLDIPLACGPDAVVVSGTVFLDEDNDCEFDTLTENTLYDWQVAAIDLLANDTVFFATIGNGAYNFLLDPGTYALFVQLPNATWQTCVSPLIVTVDDGCHTGFDFPVQAGEMCPLLEVDVSTAALRPCFSSTYFVQYCNLGSETATGASIDVTLDSAMVFVSSPFPLTQSGQVLTFDIGDVEPLECATLNFKIFLDCGATVGMTHCVEAHIFPDTTCVPLNPLWDLSSVLLTGKCEGDSVLFTLENVGTGDMTQVSEYIIIEDNVLIRSDQFQLPSGEDTTMVIYPEGATLRMEAGQSPFHPGNSMPSISLEGCGSNAGGGTSLGFVAQYPENDADPFISIECLESVGSFDPNDKQAFPKGVGSGHFIRPNTDIEYKIRFQNTGTAAASKVVVRDTLSAFLDAEKLRPGVSSHAYEFELENGNVAVFTFENINLPDSTSNLEGSMGFVKFKIPQTPDNQPATTILNSAAIYFDFNPPIITNLTEHQIPLPVYEQNFTPEICLGDEWMGFEITGDTTISETVDFAFFEEVTTYEVTALENAFSEQDISLLEGEVYHGTAIFSDTILIEVLASANGCDSTVTTNITVLPNSVSDLGFGLSANVFPNPASGWFYVEMDCGRACPELASGGMDMEILMSDVLGKNIVQISGHQFFAAGKHRVKVEVGDLPDGIYYLHLRSGNGVWSGKVNLR